MKGKLALSAIVLLLMALAWEHSKAFNAGVSAFGRSENLVDLPAEMGESSCPDLSFAAVREKYPENDVTSGRSNPPALLKGCTPSPAPHFGFYDFIDRRPGQRPSVLAKAIVSFSDLPWNYSDAGQELQLLVVHDASFKCHPFPFGIGDGIERADASFPKLCEIDGIHYYQDGACTVAVKVQGGLISKYMFWTCGATAAEIQADDSAVRGFLK